MKEEDTARLPESQTQGAKGSRGPQWFQGSDSGDARGE